VKFDKDMMALFRAMKKTSRPPAATIVQRRKPHHEHSPPNESAVPDQNIEPHPGVGTAKGFAPAFREPNASRRVAFPRIGACQVTSEPNAVIFIFL